MTAELALTQDRRRAVALDNEIGELLRDFIPLGIKLMEMRDSRLYLELENPETGEPFQFFEEYCKVKQGFAQRQTSNIIRSSLVGKLLESSNSAAALQNTRQATLLAEAVAEFDYGPGTSTRVPVAVKNRDEVKKVWHGVAEKFAAELSRAKKEKLEKKPRLTVTFITKALPDKYRRRLPNPLVTRGKVGQAGAVAKVAGRLTDIIRKAGLDDLDRLKALAIKEEWTVENVAEMRDAMKEVGDAIIAARETLSRLRL